MGAPSPTRFFCSFTTLTASCLALFQSRSLCASPLPEPSPSLTSSSSSSSPSEWGSQTRSASPGRPGQASPLPYQQQEHQRQRTPQNTLTVVVDDEELGSSLFSNLSILSSRFSALVPRSQPHFPQRAGGVAGGGGRDRIHQRLLQRWTAQPVSASSLLQELFPLGLRPVIPRLLPPPAAW